MSRDRTVGETFYIAFTTRAFATGIPTTLAGTPVVSAYEDASLTQITAGITLGVDHDSVAGLNLLTIVATGANGFEAGKDYNLVVTTGTVGGVSVVGEVVGQFSLGLSAAFTRLGTPAGASVSVDIANVPTVAEFTARTILAADYFDPSADTVTNVTLVGTTIANTDMRGTDGGALATALATAQTDLDTLTGSDGAILASSQPNQDYGTVTKNAVFSNFEFLMVLTSDHVTPATGLTVTGQRSIDGAGFVSVAGTIAEVSNGIYQFDALAADTNGNVITWRFTSATADDTFVTLTTTT